MSEMIERIEDAIMSKSQGHIYEEGQIREMARAAAAAMREPTRDMDLAWIAASAEREGRCLNIGRYQAMIDAALGDREGNGTERPQVERDKSRDEPK